MSWNDDEEMDEMLDDIYTWEVKIGRKSEQFETKQDAIYYIIDEIDELSDNKLTDDYDSDELFESLIDVAYDDFYDNIKDVLKKLKLKITIKLISLDNAEPEFGEL